MATLTPSDIRREMDRLIDEAERRKVSLAHLEMKDPLRWIAAAKQLLR